MKLQEILCLVLVVTRTGKNGDPNMPLLKREREREGGGIQVLVTFKLIFVKNYANSCYAQVMVLHR